MRWQSTLASALLSSSHSTTSFWPVKAAHWKRSPPALLVSVEKQMSVVFQKGLTFGKSPTAAAV
jgi:hypothetical protein